MGACTSSTTPSMNEPFPVAEVIHQVIADTVEGVVADQVEGALGTAQTTEVVTTSPSSPVVPAPPAAAAEAVVENHHPPPARRPLSKVAIAVHAFFVVLSAVLYAYHLQLGASIN